MTPDALLVTFAVGDEWPTPTNIRRAADALDAITPAHYGDILRAFADAEDERYAKHGPVEAIRRSQRKPRRRVKRAATGLADPREASRE